MTTESLHDFVAAAALKTNEQKMLEALLSIDETVKSLETRLFAYINHQEAKVSATAMAKPDGVTILKGSKGK